MRIFVVSLFLMSCTCNAEIIKMRLRVNSCMGRIPQKEKHVRLLFKKRRPAVRKIYGEKVSVTEQLSCKEEGSREDNTNCVYHSYLWNTIDGKFVPRS